VRRGEGVPSTPRGGPVHESLCQGLAPDDVAAKTGDRCLRSPRHPLEEPVSVLVAQLQRARRELLRLVPLTGHDIVPAQELQRIDSVNDPRRVAILARDSPQCAAASCDAIDSRRRKADERHASRILLACEGKICWGVV
jgi:hypothetical protein